MSRYLLVQVEDVTEKEEEEDEAPPPPDQAVASLDPKTPLISLGGQDIKGKLAGLFSNSSKPRANQPTAATAATTAGQEQLPPAPASASGRKKKAPGCADWADGFMPRGRSEISESCRQAFTAACHLLLECTTFPVYLSEEETQAQYSKMFIDPGEPSRAWCRAG